MRAWVGWLGAALAGLAVFAFVYFGVDRSPVLDVPDLHRCEMREAYGFCVSRGASYWAGESDFELDRGFAQLSSRVDAGPYRALMGGDEYRSVDGDFVLLSADAGSGVVALWGSVTRTRDFDSVRVGEGWFLSGDSSRPVNLCRSRGRVWEKFGLEC